MTKKIILIGVISFALAGCNSTPTKNGAFGWAGDLHKKDSLEDLAFSSLTQSYAFADGRINEYEALSILGSWLITRVNKHRRERMVKEAQAQQARKQAAQTETQGEQSHVKK